MKAKDRIYSKAEQKVLELVHVNIPFTMLTEDYWREFVLSFDLNPEIGIDAAALDNYEVQDFEAAAQSLHERNLSITIHGPFLDLSPGSPDKVMRDASVYRFSQMLEAARVMAPETIVCHASYDACRYDFCREEWIENSIKTWEWLGQEVGRQGSRLMLENVYERRPEEILPVLEAFNPELVGCCLDVGHLAVFSRVSVREWIEKLSPYIGQLHLHDNNGDFDAHLGMGRGSIDFKPVFDFLSSRQQLPVITLEPHRQEELRPSVAYLGKHLTFLS